MTCRCDPIADELGRTSEPNCVQANPYQPCQPCRACSPIRQECNCCSCKKTIGKGKFGLAYIMETPRRRYTKPLGWEVEFADTPSNISYKCNKMASWANQPPISECLKTKPTFHCKCVDVKKTMNHNEQKTMCNCAKCIQCAPKVPTCVCYQEPRCSCKPKICLYCCCPKIQQLPQCTCNVHCSLALTKPKCGNFKFAKKYSKSPNREKCSCSKHRPKSRHRRRKVKQCDCQTDCEDDCLDYIPRKETCSMKETRTSSKEKDRGCSRERVCDDSCGK